MLAGSVVQCAWIGEVSGEGRKSVNSGRLGWEDVSLLAWVKEGRVHIALSDSPESGAPVG